MYYNANITTMNTTTQKITQLLQESNFTYDSYNNVAYLTSISEEEETGIEAVLYLNSLDFQSNICINGEYFISDEHQDQVYACLYDKATVEQMEIDVFIKNHQSPTHLNHPSTI